MVFGDRKDKDKHGQAADAPGDGDGGFLPDIVRRAVERSVNVVLQGDDERKKLIAALFPKELVNTVVQTALTAVDGTKREAVEMVGREMQQFLQQLNLADEIRKVLTSVSFEIRTEVRFVPNEDGTLRTEVRGAATPKIKRAPPKKARKRVSPKAKARETVSAEPTATRSPSAAAVAAAIPGALTDAVQDAVVGTTRRMRNVVDRIAEGAADLAERATGDDQD